MNSNEEQKSLGQAITDYEEWFEANGHDDSDETFALFLAAAEDREEALEACWTPEHGWIDLPASEVPALDLVNTPEKVAARKAYFTGLGWGR